jgi:hypothetical protein
LFEYALRNFLFFAGDDATRIHNFVGTAMPTHNSVDSIACDAGLVGNDGATLTNKPIEESGFANVRASDDRYQRERGGHQSLRDGTSLSFSKIAHQMMVDLNCLKVIYSRIIESDRGFENQ